MALMYRITLVSYEGSPINLPVWDVANSNRPWQGTLEQALQERDEWTARNPKGLYIVAPIQDEVVAPIQDEVVGPAKSWHEQIMSDDE